MEDIIKVYIAVFLPIVIPAILCVLLFISWFIGIDRLRKPILLLVASEFIGPILAFLYWCAFIN